ncbi:hypothetical protein Daesc_006310 [Daldinia eschscholtzii]|uniref:Uncharacterized protein n=1 Tax=Daldinia eschscholtzii TaxID=292717 RepID=A0AAX6MGQ3_9PEZI
MTPKNYTNTYQSVEDYSVGKTIRSSSIYTDTGQRSFKLSEVESFGELDMTFNTEHPLLQFQFNSMDVPGFQPPTPALRLDMQQFGSSETASAFAPLLSLCTSEDEGVRTTASDSIDAQIKDLAQLNLRVLQSSREVEQDLATMQLSVSSPSFNGLFEATELFIGLCRRVSEFQLGQSPLNYMPTNDYDYTSQGELDGSSPIDSRSNKSPIDGRLCPDGSVLLMMLAFHHRLTSIFETICSSIYYQLLPTNNTWANPKNHDLISQDDSERYQHSWINQSMSSLPTGFNTNNSYNWSLTSTAQIIMLVRLIRHLANRMNGVLRPFIEYPIELNTMPSQMSSTASNNEYTSWPTLSEAPHSADLIEEDRSTTYLDMVNVNEKSRMFENPERNRSLNNSIELGRKMRDLGWLYSYIDRIESLVEQSDRV